jgi:hypothetical protein
MSDEANTEKSIMELPVNGRGCRAFLDGKTLHLQVDLSGQGTPSSSGKTKVIAFPTSAARSRRLPASTSRPTRTSKVGGPPGLPQRSFL